MNEQYFYDGKDVLIFSDKELDPNGFPLIVQTSLQDFLENGGDKNDIISFS
jgi:hypothetical protein